MKTILLMDDTSTDSGHMASGCQIGLEEHGFHCIFDSGKDGRTGATLCSVEELGKRLMKRASESPAHGLVLDIAWGDINSDFNGFDIWCWAMDIGLSIPKNFVVFLTQHRSVGQRVQHAEDHGLSHDQVLYKNAQGNEAAVRWFCHEFGTNCPCRAKGK